MKSITRRGLNVPEPIDGFIMFCAAGMSMINSFLGELLYRKELRKTGENLSEGKVWGVLDAAKKNVGDF